MSDIAPQVYLTDIYFTILFLPSLFIQLPFALIVRLHLMIPCFLESCQQIFRSIPSPFLSSSQSPLVCY
jgi:hypothetical protein